jgi:hypothetical protein
MTFWFVNLETEYFGLELFFHSTKKKYLTYNHILVRLIYLFVSL